MPTFAPPPPPASVATLMPELPSSPSPLPAEAPDIPRIRSRIPEWSAARDRETDTHTAFGREKALRWTEARLLAWAAPDAFESELIALALDARKELEDRYWAIRALGYLCERGRPASRDTLRSLLGDQVQPLREMVVAVLSDGDLRFEHRELYFQECQRGTLEAFQALKYHADPSALALMKALPPRWAGLGSYVVPRLETLLAPDAADRVDRALASDDSQDVHWALNVVRRAPTASTLRVLRRRLDLAESASRRAFEKERAWEKAEGFEPDLRPFERRWVEEDQRGLFQDSAYDEALRTYAGLGGEVKPLERLRLERFGYLVDPARRLNELLGP